MPPSIVSMNRLELIESEIAKALAEYPSESALDRLKFVRALVGVVRHQVEDDEDATIPVLEVEAQEYRRR